MSPRALLFLFVTPHVDWSVDLFRTSCIFPRLLLSVHGLVKNTWIRSTWTSSLTRPVLVVSHIRTID